MSILDGNLERLLCIKDSDVRCTDRVLKATLGLLHRESKHEDEFLYLVRRLKEAVVNALSVSLGEDGIPGITDAQLQTWRHGLQTLQSALNALMSESASQGDSSCSMMRAEIHSFVQERMRWQREYKHAFEQSLKELESTNSGRLRLAQTEVKLGFNEAGIEREEHFRASRQSLSDLLSDLAGDLCGPGWCLNGLVEIWTDADPESAKRSLTTALRRVRISESAVTIVSLRARSYLYRQQNDFESALTDINRALDLSEDPDIALEALSCAVAVKNGMLAARMVENCVSQSPLWAVLILGDEQLAPAHAAAIKAFDRQGNFIREGVIAEIHAATATAEKIRQLGESCELDFTAASAKCLPARGLAESAANVDPLALYSIKSMVTGNRKSAERSVTEMLTTQLQVRQSRLNEMEAVQMVLKNERAKSLRETKDWLDRTLTHLQNHHNELVSTTKVSDATASRGFALSFILFIAYLAIGIYMAFAGVSLTIARPFGFVGLAVSSLPSIRIILRQANHSIREWSAEASHRRQVISSQARYMATLETIESQFQAGVEKAEQNYRSALEGVKRVQSAIQLLNQSRNRKDDRSSTSSASETRRGA